MCPCLSINTTTKKKSACATRACAQAFSRVRSEVLFNVHEIKKLFCIVNSSGVTALVVHFSYAALRFGVELNHSTVLVSGFLGKVLTERESQLFCAPFQCTQQSPS